MNLENVNIDKFKIIRQISKIGGTSQIYLGCVTNSPDNKVVIKIANSKDNQEAPENYLIEREADILSRWDWRHPGIVRLFPINNNYLFEVKELTWQPKCIIMEYLSGKSLASNFDKIEKFPLSWKVELFFKIVQTISFLHQKGYAHRDLKPENILLRQPISVNKPPDPVIIDFALAWNGVDDVDYIHSSYTLAYASPERVLEEFGFSAENQLLASDIWSLGVIFHEIITGKPLLTGSSNQIRTTIIESRLDINLPDDNIQNQLIKQFIREMLRKDPYNRPTIDLIIKALEIKFPPPRI